MFRFAFQIYDVDGDGLISREELFMVMIFVKRLGGWNNVGKRTGAADDGWEEPKGGAVAQHREQVNDNGNICDSYEL